MRFERGKDPKDTMELGVMAKLEKYGSDILSKYHFEFMNEETIKQIEYEFEQLLGFPVEVINENKDNQSSITIKIKK